MQEVHCTDDVYGSTPPEQPHIVEEGDEPQSLSGGQAVPMTQFAASQGYSYEGHQAPPGMQNLQLLGCSEGQLQADEEEGMWVEGDYLKCHPAMMNLQFHPSCSFVPPHLFYVIQSHHFNSAHTSTKRH